MCVNVLVQIFGITLQKKNAGNEWLFGTMPGIENVRHSHFNYFFFEQITKSIIKTPNCESMQNLSIFQYIPHKGVPNKIEAHTNNNKKQKNKTALNVCAFESAEKPKTIKAYKFTSSYE